MSALVDLSGQTFGRLTVVGQAPRRNNDTMWHCKCSCGSTSSVQSKHLRNGCTRSCGCLQAELARDKRLKPVCDIHGRFRRPLKANPKKLICNKCESLRRNKWAEVNLEKLRESQRQYARRNSKSIATYRARWEKENPDKRYISSVKEDMKRATGVPRNAIPLGLIQAKLYQLNVKRLMRGQEHEQKD